MPEVETDATPAPVVENAPVEVSDGVFVIPDGRVPLVPNVGIVRGSRAVLVVDTGMGPAKRRDRAAARRGARRRPAALPHGHALPPRARLRRAGVRGRRDDRLQPGAARRAARRRAPAYLEMFRTFGDAVAAQLEGVELVEPHVVYEGAAEIDLGGPPCAAPRVRRGAHARRPGRLPPASSVSSSPATSSRSAASRSSPGSRPTTSTSTATAGSPCCEQLERLEPDVVVPGHGEVGDAEVIVTAREYLEQLRDETERLAGAGRPRTRSPPSSTGRCASSIRTGRSPSGSPSARAASTRRTCARRPGAADPLWRPTGHSSASPGSISASAASTPCAAPSSPSAAARCTASSAKRLGQVDDAQDPLGPGAARRGDDRARRRAGRVPRPATRAAPGHRDRHAGDDARRPSSRSRRTSSSATAWCGAPASGSTGARAAGARAEVARAARAGVSIRRSGRRPAARPAADGRDRARALDRTRAC